jgi:hypothetical protein
VGLSGAPIGERDEEIARVSAAALEACVDRPWQGVDAFTGIRPR